MPLIFGSFDGKVINVGSLSLAEEIPVTFVGFVCNNKCRDIVLSERNNAVIIQLRLTVK